MAIWDRFKKKEDTGDGNLQYSTGASSITASGTLRGQRQRINRSSGSPGYFNPQRGRLNDQEKNHIEDRLLELGYDPKTKPAIFNAIADELGRNSSTIRSHLASSAADVPGKIKKRPARSRSVYTTEVQERVVLETELPHVTVRDVAFWYNLTEQRINNWRDKVLDLQSEAESIVNDPDLDFHESELLEYFNSPPELSIDNLEVHVNQVQNLMIKLLPVIKTSAIKMSEVIGSTTNANPQLARRHLAGVFENTIRDIDKYRHTFDIPLTATELFEKLKNEIGEEEAIRRLLKNG